MGNIDLEVAQVLEDAADLYESETIDWCAGTWATRMDGRRLSMCAEGALLKAAGYEEESIFNYCRITSDTFLRIAGGDTTYNRYAGARAVVSAVVEIGIPGWNDEILAQDLTTGKQKVIDTFREIAKDIRNQAPATVLHEYQGEAAA